MNSFLLYGIVFLCSLDGFVRLRAIFAIVLVIVFLVINGKEIKNYKFLKEHVFWVVFFSIIFLLYTLLAFFYPEIYLQIPQDESNFYFKVIDRFSLILLFFLIPFLFSNNKYLKIFKNVVFFHMLFLIIQFFSYYIFNYNLDFTKYFGVDQRTLLGIQGESFYRPSGLFVEPSNYAAVISALYFPYVYLKKKFTFVDFLPVFSIVLTLSTAAFIVGILYVIGMFLKNEVYKKIKGIFFIIFSSFIFLYILSFHYVRLMSDGGGTNNIRMDLITYVLNSRMDDFLLFAFGSGIYSYDYQIYLREISGFGRDISSIQDVTLFLYNFITLGIFGLIFLIFLILKVEGKSNKFFILAIFISKITYLYPVFLFVLIYILYGKRWSIK